MAVNVLSILYVQTQQNWCEWGTKQSCQSALTAKWAKTLAPAPTPKQITSSKLEYKPERINIQFNIFKNVS